MLSKVGLSLWASFLILILIVFFFSGTGYSAWVTNGPYHKNVKCVEVSPFNSNIIYAGAFGFGVFKSTDGGVSWKNYTSGLTNTYIRSLLPLSDTLVYAGTNDGIFKSTDGGINWSLSLTTLNSVRSLTFDRHTNKIYAGTYGQGIYESSNFGSTWNQIIVKDDTSLQTLSHIRTVEVYGRDSIYAGGSISDISAGGALFRSINGGASWVQVQRSTGIRSSVMSIALSPLNPDNSLIIGTAAKGVYKSTNGGVNWTQINGDSTSHPLADKRVNSVGFNTNYRYAGTDSLGGFYYRALGDTTVGWLAGLGVPGIGTALNFIYIDTLNRNFVWVGTEGKGVYKSTDSGLNWNPENSGMMGTAGRSVKVNSNGNLILGTGFGDGIWFSTNQGSTWIKSESLSTSNSINSIALTSNPAIIFAGAYGTGVYKSTDGGNIWVLTDTLVINHYIRAVVASASDLNTAYAGTGNGVFKTTNGGTNWSVVNTGIPFSTSIHSMAIDPTNQNIVYAGTDSFYLYKTTNGGGNWTHITSSNGFGINDKFIRSITVDPASPNLVYAGSDSGHIYRSSNYGDNWSFLAQVPAVHSVRSILLDPNDPKILFCATFGNGVFVSTDSGYHWTSMNAGLSDSSVYSLDCDKSNPLNLYAGTEASGVFHMTYGSSSFKHGDANGDGKLTVADVVFMIGYLFKGGPGPNPLLSGDANCDGKVTVADVVYLIGYLFKGGAAPPC